MLTNRDKIDVLNDRITGMESYMLELKTSLDLNHIDESQIDHINEVILDGKKTLDIFKSLLRQIDPNAII
jgi:hypothetical protein